jgi:hypothetical protein
VLGVVSLIETLREGKGCRRCQRILAQRTSGQTGRSSFIKKPGRSIRSGRAVGIAKTICRIRSYQ